jgi:hypothetical protein
MARIPVNVQLEILVLVEKASSGLVDEQVVGVLLRDQVRVVAMAQRSSDLDCLSGQLKYFDWFFMQFREKIPRGG